MEFLVIILFLLSVFIGIPYAIGSIGKKWDEWVWNIKWSSKKYQKKQTEYLTEKNLKNATLDNYYTGHGYDYPPTVTGDHYTKSYKYEDSVYDRDMFDEYYCRYRTSSNCANCRRRKEYQVNGKYFYGPSSDCVSYSRID